jgi:hypothetical protein
MCYSIRMLGFFFGRVETLQDHLLLQKESSIKTFVVKTLTVCPAILNIAWTECVMCLKHIKPRQVQV